MESATLNRLNLPACDTATPHSLYLFKHRDVTSNDDSDRKQEGTGIELGGMR